MHQGGAGCDHHPVEVVLDNVFLDDALPAVRARVRRVNRAHDAGQRQRKLCYLGRVDHPCDVAATAADEYAHTRLVLRRHGSLRRVLGWRNQSAPCPADGRQGASCGSAGLDDAIRNIFGLSKGATDEYAGARGFHWMQRVRPAESIRIQFDVGRLGKRLEGPGLDPLLSQAVARVDEIASALDIPREQWAAVAADALDALDASSRPLAGGTDLIGLMKQGLD